VAYVPLVACTSLGDEEEGDLGSFPSEVLEEKPSQKTKKLSQKSKLKTRQLGKLTKKQLSNEYRQKIPL